MLSAIWLILGTATSFWCCYKEVKAEKDGDREDPFIWIFGALFATVICLTLTSSATVVPVFQWLLTALPEHGTDLNQITAFALCGILSAAYVVGLPLAFIFALTIRDEKAPVMIEEKKFPLTLVWQRKQ